MGCFVITKWGKEKGGFHMCKEHIFDIWQKSRLFNVKESNGFFVRHVYSNHYVSKMELSIHCKFWLIKKAEIRNKLVNKYCNVEDKHIKKNV